MVYSIPLNILLLLARLRNPVTIIIGNTLREFLRCQLGAAAPQDRAGSYRECNMLVGWETTCFVDGFSFGCALVASAQ